MTSPCSTVDAERMLLYSGHFGQATSTITTQKKRVRWIQSSHENSASLKHLKNCQHIKNHAKNFLCKAEKRVPIATCKKNIAQHRRDAGTDTNGFLFLNIHARFERNICYVQIKLINPVTNSNEIRDMYKLNDGTNRQSIKTPKLVP